MRSLNYHHLLYFYAIVREGSLTQAAHSLHISQSALSIQLRKLEEQLECALFDRQHKSLILTEEGRMVMDYAETIFRTGEELMATLQHQNTRFRNVLRVGAVSTLSKNFQLSFLREALMDTEVEVIIHAGSLAELLEQLQAHTLDLVLSNTPILRDREQVLRSHLVDTQPVSLIAPKSFRHKKNFSFPNDLRDIPLILPSTQSSLRNSFDLIMEQAGISPLIAAEADDMAMLRLLAREMNALALLPPVVVQDELRTGELRTVCQVPSLEEAFYAITARRRYPSRYVKKLLHGTGGK